MMTEEDWGGEAPLKVRAERKVTYIYLCAYRNNEKKNCESKVKLSDDSTGQ